VYAAWPAHQIDASDLVEVAAVVADLGDVEIGEAFLDGLVRAAAPACITPCDAESRCDRHRLIEAQADALHRATERPDFALLCLDLMMRHDVMDVLALDELKTAATASLKANIGVLGEYDINLEMSCRGSVRGRVVLGFLAAAFDEAYQTFVEPLKQSGEESLCRLLKSMRLWLSEIDDPHTALAPFMMLADRLMANGSYRHQHGSDVVSELLPAPTYDSMAREPEADFLVACSRWPTVEELSPTLDDWFAQASGCGLCTNALTQLIRTRDLTWQIDDGSTLLSLVLAGGNASDCGLVAARLLDIVTESGDLSSLRLVIPFVQLLDRLASAGLQHAIDAQDLLEM